MTKPTVTIVTPSYNQAAFLEETMRSVLEQDYEPIEYIVVDGGSTDGSIDLIRQYEDRLAWWVSEPDRGQAHAINKGLVRSTGDLMAYLNSDDTLVPGAIARFVNVLEPQPDLVAVYGDAVWLDESGRDIGYAPARSWAPVEMLTSGSARLHQPSSMWRRQGWEAVGRFEESLHFTFDTLFFIRLAGLGPAEHLPEPLAGYRLHTESKTYTEPPPKLAEYVRLADEFLVPERLPAILKPHARRARASYYRRAALGYYNAGDRPQARSLFLRSLRLSPRMSRRTARAMVPTILPGAVVGLRRRLRGRR